MPVELIRSRITRLVGALPPKTKQPNSAAVLTKWIALAESQVGPDGTSGRLGWLVASSVAIAAVQRAVDAEGRQPFCCFATGAGTADRPPWSSFDRQGWPSLRPVPLRQDSSAIPDANGRLWSSRTTIGPTTTEGRRSLAALV